MATLRSFQTEIEEIRHRELAKQRGTHSSRDVAEGHSLKEAKASRLVEAGGVVKNDTEKKDGYQQSILPGDDESLSIQLKELEVSKFCWTN